MTHLPKVSVITVVYNGAEFIEETINSVISQDYPNTEYIVVDGKSTDGTVEILHNYINDIDCLVSEKDNGIYDAMNKGIDLASGEWVIFMNCGDYFVGSKVLNNIFSIPISTDVKLLYGGCKVRSDWGDFEINARSHGQIWKSFTHQSIFTRIEVHRELKFNLEFKAASDYDFVYRVFSKGSLCLRLDMLVSDIQYISSGFSSVNELLSLKEVLKSLMSHRNNLKSSYRHMLYHWFGLTRKYVSIYIRLISPAAIRGIRNFRDVKRK